MRPLPDIYEVGPRDGFQNIREFIPTELKRAIIDRLLRSGVKRLQLTSFVSPRAVPQLADARSVAGHFVGRYPDVRFGALVPNLIGARAARDCGILEINYVASVSPSHNRSNINRTHDQSFAELALIRRELPDLHVLFGAATAFACPFEGRTSLDALLRFLERAVRCGAETLELADTIGMACPTQVEQALLAVSREFPGVKVGVHFHDTRNNGMLNTWLALQLGVDYVQTAIGGLGGCPFAPGASGNTATEDLVWLLEQSGLSTGLDFAALLDCARHVRAHVAGNYSSHHLNLAPEPQRSAHGQDAG